ncbi:MAG: F0F1 ATP synthase subunit C [Alphaproteobacteria bacterium]|nr:F0F1 ATP synthase subunit C [Alphaproteobacteria bacterium]
MESNAIALLGAGVAMVGSLGAGIGLGLLFSGWISAIARNPGAASKFNGIGFIGFAVTELVLLLCFVIAFMLMGKAG